jgi:hypothetical protein
MGKLGVVTGLALVTSSLLAGCASTSATYTPPTAGAPSANLTLAETKTGMFAADNVQYHLFDNPECTETPGSGFVGLLAPMRPKNPTTAIRAGERIYLRAYTVRHSSSFDISMPSGVAMSVNDCGSLTSFSPLSGRSYTVTQAFRGGRCGVDLFDTATGSPPPDLIRHEPVPVSCKLGRWRGRAD